MAVLQSIRNLFAAAPVEDEEEVVPAPPDTAYSIKPLTSAQLKEVLRLNIRCFPNGDNYTRHTFAYLLSESNTLSYRVVTGSGDLAAFIFVMTNETGAGHITTIGVAPEHRRRGLAAKLLAHTEDALRRRGITTVMLEVRVSNTAAQHLYRRAGYTAVQRLPRYYNNGEDCFLMMRSLVPV